MNSPNLPAIQTHLAKLPFKEIPGSSKLFLDYLYDTQQISRFYQSLDPSSNLLDSSKSLLKNLSQNIDRIIRRSYQRDLVATALIEQNKSYGSSEKTFQNIELLKNPNTVAIITGQQAGLFGGPLFTIYKALTAIKISDELSKEGLSVVPVFWVASEDHDYQEVSHIKTINREGLLTTIEHSPQGNIGQVPVGNLTIAETISNDLTQLFACLPQSEYITQLETDLRNCYSSNKGFANAFACLLAKLFAPYGVILLDPQDKHLKQIASPIFEKAITNTEEIAQILVNRSQQLESSNYHAQVHTSLDMSPFFILEDGNRTALTHQNKCFTLKHTDKKKTSAELLEKLHQDPSSFSPNVILRPIVQDYLLPTLAYVGGPAEVAYFAQISAIYPLFPVEFPLIIPRTAFTIVPNRENNLLEKWGLALSELFSNVDSAKRRVIENTLDQGTLNIFSETEQLFQNQLDKLQESLTKIDPTLAEALKGGKEKIFYQITNLKTRFINNSAKREETFMRQVERTFTLLYPNKNLQERELNHYYFLARYGYQFINLIYNNCDLNLSDHNILHL